MLTDDDLESSITEDFSEHPNNATEALELVLDSSQEVSDPSITPLTLSPSIIPLAKPAEKSAAIASSLISSHTLGTKILFMGILFSNLKSFWVSELIIIVAL